ncbi:hypothetical protein NPIL_336361 [Nephila pilipes]|uniref:Uncharacterized protein n=1 Tax=Nephila pilipes TaxID=299642 RepID=A0A8X6PCM3_NEPPI|nr:hypothetical protein NPIL_336361 [Nephila pilipes]
MFKIQCIKISSNEFQVRLISTQNGQLNIPLDTWHFMNRSTAIMVCATTSIDCILNQWPSRHRRKKSKGDISNEMKSRQVKRPSRIIYLHPNDQSQKSRGKLNNEIESPHVESTFSDEPPEKT